MTASAQLWTSFQCLIVGFLSGGFYEIFSILRWLTGCKNKRKPVLTAVFDVLFFVCFAVFAVFCATILEFSSFRAFMAVGYGLGFIIYLKILHRILAFFEKVCYNTVKKALKRLKKNKKTEKTPAKRLANKKVGESL